VRKGTSFVGALISVMAEGQLLTFLMLRGALNIVAESVIFTDVRLLLFLSLRLASTMLGLLFLRLLVCLRTLFFFCFFLASDLLVGFLLDLLFKSFTLLFPVDDEHGGLAWHSRLPRDHYVSLEIKL